MKNNNALPEWVELNKEIKLNTKFAIEKLTVAYRNYLNPDATTSSVPTITSNKNEKSLLKEIKSWFSLDLVPKVRKLTQFEKEHLWNQSKEEFNQTIKKINNQIQHYNVFVPVSFQKYFLIVEDEIADVMEKVERELQNK